MIGLAFVVGGGFAGGFCLVASGLRPGPNVDGQRSDPNNRVHRLMAEVGRLDRVGVMSGIGVGLLAWMVTRWPVVAVGAAIAAAWLAGALRRAERDEAEVCAALALWCESLRDTAATARGLEGILTATAPSAPPVIRPAVLRMADRLPTESLDNALVGLGDDLNHPIGDLVVTALRLASTAGSRRIRQVMRDLAQAARDEAAMFQRVEVARQRPRSTMRMVVVVVACFVAGLLLLARDYLDPYGTAVGQLILALVAVYWALAFWWMARLGRVVQVERYYAPGSSTTGAVA
jgi:hypothetical protein